MYIYISLFSLNAGKYGPDETLYLDTFHLVINCCVGFLRP